MMLFMRSNTFHTRHAHYTLHSVLFHFTTGLIFEHFLEEKCNLEKISGFIFFFGKIINELCVVTLLRIISGARYSGVPHNVQVLPLTRLANPKSVICKWNGINNLESFSKGLGIIIYLEVSLTIKQ